MKTHEYPYVNKRKKTIRFMVHNSCADHIALSGTFNHWSPNELLLKQDRQGQWYIEIPLLPQGKYHYKFFIDDRMWMEDIENMHREPDGISGWNSVLMIG